MHTTHRAGAFRTGIAALCLAFVPFVASCAMAAAGDAPTKEDVQKVLAADRDRPATSISPKMALTVDDVRFGTPYTATAQEVQVEGLPADATVTPAIIDYTIRTYYTSETRLQHQSREGRVYRDKMGDWMVSVGAVKGEDTATTEAAAAQ